MNFINRKPKTLDRILAGLTMFLMVMSTGGITPAYAAEEILTLTVVSSPKIDICHATSKGYDNGKKEVDQSSILGGTAHDAHSSGGYDGRGDIIPPFGDYLGKNWDTTGQAIWNNDCKAEGKITVDKVLVGKAYKDGGNEVLQSDFKLFANGEKITDNKGRGTAPGEYLITETPNEGVPTNFTTIFSGDCNANGEMTIGIGDDKKCTITNDYTPRPTTGTIIVQKIFANGTTPVAEEKFSFILGTTAAIPFEADGENQLKDQAPGHYTITEAPSTNYTPSYSNCDFELTAGETETCVITNTYKKPESNTGTIKITKYECPADTVIKRSVNGVGGTVPAGCTLDEGAFFGYVHGEQTNAGPEYPELTVTPTPAGSTNASGILEIPNLSATGRYLVVETDSSNNKLAHDAILGLFCTGDGDTSDNNDNQELTFVPKEGTVNCVAYNKKPVEPQYCTIEIVSDTTNTVTEKTGAFAKALTYIHTAWTAVVPGAIWIWGDNPVANPVADETQTFNKSFAWNGPVTSATLEIAADNSYTYSINASNGSDATEKNFTAAGQDTYNVTSAITSGTNNLAIAVKNWAGNSNPKANPAGLLYKLTVKGTDKNCGQIPEENTETIKMCKINAESEAPIAGWNMTLSNGKTSKTYTTEAETGCVSATVDPSDGPWTVKEVNQPNWNLVDVFNDNDNGGYIYEDDSDIKIGCTFFGSKKTSDESTSEYSCTFVNEESPYNECISTENLLTNGSFEDPMLNDGEWKPVSGPIGWVVKKVSDAVDTVLEFHRGWSGNVAAKGEQYVELGSNEATQISQAVATENGATYKLIWSFAPRQDTNADENALSVLINDTQVATEGPTVGMGVLKASDWTQNSYHFTASANTKITFKDVGTGSLGSYGTFVDNAYLCKVKSVTKHTIYGSKWNDLDGDGVWDQGEPGIQGWTIEATDGETKLTTTTDSEGKYTFEVADGTWTVNEVQQTGWDQTAVWESGTKQDGSVCEFSFAQLRDNETGVLNPRCDFGNKKQTSSTIQGGGGGCDNCGSVRGAKTKREKKEIIEEDAPEGEVQGVQTTKVPTVAGASTGAGGTSPSPYSAMPLMALMTMFASVAVLRTTKFNEM